MARRACCWVGTRTSAQGRRVSMNWSSKTVIRRVALVAAPVLAIAAGGIVYATVSNAAPTTANGKDFTPGRYLVIFADAPVLGYDGYVAGIPATKPTEGQHIDPTSAKVKGWQKHLQDKHDALLNSVG